jgi:catechol 2,3-dioxygenase-like lactoylglutathione lyase family enzyme
MEVTGIDHIVLDVADVERSVAWYRDRLGLEPLRLEEWRNGEVLFVSLRIDETTIIDLLHNEPTGENMNHVALLVEGVDLDELAATGEWEIEAGPADLFGAQGTGRGFYTRDPDGHLVELRTYA